MAGSEIFRWQCPACGKHGRWLLDSHNALQYGVRHEGRCRKGASRVLVVTPDGRSMRAVLHGWE